MLPYVLCIAILFSSVSTGSDAESSVGNEDRTGALQMRKVQTIFYRLPSCDMPSAWRHSLNFGMDPIFCVFKNGNSVFVDANRELLFFDDTQRLIATAGGTGEMPGRFPKGCKSIARVGGDCVAAVDGAGRINVWDSKGDLVRSLILADFEAILDMAGAVGDTLIISGGFTSSKGEVKAVKAIDPRTFQYAYTLDSALTDCNSEISRKHATILNRAYFNVTDGGVVICNYSSNAGVKTVDLKSGSTHKTTDIPPNFTPLSKAPELVLGSSEEESSPDHVIKVLGEWGATWSYSGCPSIYADSLFVIRRRMCAPYYLDFYSVEDCKYLGQCRVEKPFMCSDSKWIYLCENFNDTLMTVGKYRIDFGHEKVTESSAIEYLDEPPKDILGQMSAGPGKDAKERESVGDMLITLPAGDSTSIWKYLSSESNHVLLFFSPFQCPAGYFMITAKRFVSDSDAFDFLVVVTHQDPSDLTNYATGLANRYGVTVLMNTDSRRLQEMGVDIQPLLIVVDKNGRILGKYSLFMGTENLDSFLKDLAGGRE